MSTSDTASPIETTDGSPAQQQQSAGENRDTTVNPFGRVLELSLCALSFTQYIATSILGMYVFLDLKWGPSDLTRFWMYLGWAAWLSPLVGWLSDSIVISGERRRPCIIVGLVFNIVCWIAIFSLPHASRLSFVALCFFQTFAQMMVVVPMNGMVVECCNAGSAAKHSAGVGRAQARAMLLRTTGSLIGSVVQTVSLLFLSVRQMLLVSAFLYTACIALVCFIREPTTSASPIVLSVKEKCCKMMHKLTSTCEKQSTPQLFSFISILLFVFVYNAVPEGSVVYSEYVGVSFEFSPWILSAINGVGLIGSVWACILYSKHMVSKDQFVLFGCGCAFASLAYLTNIALASGFATYTLHIPALVYIPIDNFVVSVLQRLAFMPVLQVAAERCPKGFEAFVFEIFTVASLGASSVSALLTAKIADELLITYNDWSNMWLFLLVCAACKWIPVFFAALLPRRPTTAAPSSEDPTSPLISNVASLETLPQSPTNPHASESTEPSAGNVQDGEEEARDEREGECKV